MSEDHPIEILTFFTHEFVLWHEDSGSVIMWHEALPYVREALGQSDPTPLPGWVYSLEGHDYLCVHIDALDWHADD